MLAALTKQLFTTLPAFIPALLVIAGVLVWHWWPRPPQRSPLKDKLLRPPGESLRRKLDASFERLPEFLLGLLLYSVAWFALFALFRQWRFKSASWHLELALFTVAFLAINTWVTWLIIRQLRRWRDESLGLRGERAVGEELNVLMRDGCHVFHDIPGSGAWNVDHVVVAPSGVYAVETKTRRKGKCAPGHRDYEVIYDGKTLQFPHCHDTHGLDQARANAKWLSRHLSDATGEDLKVTPVLTFPGWLVSSRVRPSGHDLCVLSHKQIRGLITSRPPVLDQRRITQIAHQLDQRCRDVEI